MRRHQPFALPPCNRVARDSINRVKLTRNDGRCKQILPGPKRWQDMAAVEKDARVERSRRTQQALIECLRVADELEGQT